MRNGRNTGLRNLLSVKTAIFTGLLAGAMALTACSGPGTAGRDGRDGKDGTGGGGGGGGGGSGSGLESISAGKHCTEFTFNGIAEGTETGANRRKFAVIAINERGGTVPDKALDDQYSDSKGCVDLKIIKGHLNKVTVTKSTGSNENFSFFVNGSDVVAAERIVNLTANDVTEYLLRMANISIYDVNKIPNIVLGELYDSMRKCSDLADDHESGYLGAGTKLGAGIHSIVKCLQANPTLMKKLATKAHIFKPSDGKFAGRDLDDSGTSLTSNASFLGNSGTASFGDGNFSIVAATAGGSCTLDRIMLANDMNVTYQIAGNLILQNQVVNSCTRTNFDDKYDGIHGVETIGSLGMEAHYGFVLLSRGEDNTGDAGTFEYITAGIAYFGAKGNSDSYDWNLTTGDYQDYNLSNFYPGTNTLLMVDNMDEDSFVTAVTTPTDGMGPVVDEHTTWMIFQAATSATVFASATAPATYYDDALTATANASLFQECNPSEAVKFTIAGYTANPTTQLIVRQQVTDSYEFGVENENNFRLIAGSMLMTFLSVAEPDSIGAVAEAAMDRIEADPVLSLLIDRRDILTSGGAVSIPPVALLQMIARTGALCVPEVVALGGGSMTEVGDDMLPVELDSDGKIASVITWPGSSRPNHIFSGVAPHSKCVSSCSTNQDDIYSNLTGICASYCADPAVKEVSATVGSIVHKATAQ